MARRLFPELSREDHGRKAREFAERAGEARRRYKETLDRAVERYGDLASGQSAVSGIYNTAFPVAVKDKLRSILGDVNDLTYASVAHHEASGRRTPWRDSELKNIATPPGSYY